MSGPASPSTDARLKMAMQCLDRRDPAAAIAILIPMLQWKASADAHLVMGAACHMQGRIADAEDQFRRSLALKPKQANVLSNLGHVLREQGKFLEAIQAFRQAIRIDPSYLEAHLGLARTLNDSGDLPGAERSYRNALRLRPGHIQAKQNLGVLLIALDRTPEAQTILRQALAETSDPALLVGLEHALGAAATRQNRHQEALAHFDKAKKLDPSLPQIDHNRAMVLQRLYRDEEALDILKGLVRRDPGNLDAHHYLNHVLYRLKRDGEFLSSYDEAAARLPGATALPLAKARFLLSAERFAEAREIFAATLKRGEMSAAAGLMIASTHLRDFEAAVAAGEQAAAAFPHDVNIHAGIASALLQMGEPRRAEAAIANALALDPHSQVALALQGLAWRMTGDARDGDLNDYHKHIRVYDLAPPEGYDDMAAFNRDLNRALDGLHPDAREYVDQSLRHGTQTVGNIFGAGHDLVERLRVRIAEAVNSYVAAMPDLPSHPLFGRRSGGVRFAGSWSSRLRDCGFHTSHIHAEGWISSCYYVDVPDAAADAQKRQGWIEFGKPSYDLALTDKVRRSIQPKPGQLILFPSYMWHGTVPFHAATNRTTIAFDAVPTRS